MSKSKPQPWVILCRSFKVRDVNGVLKWEIPSGVFFYALPEDDRVVDSVAVTYINIIQ